MADENHELQKDPPEGSRKVIERELERQAAKEQPSDKGKSQDRADSSKGAADK